MSTPFPPAACCSQCGAQLAPALLACPSCGRLVHAERLRALAAQAEEAARQNDLHAALSSWREALDLLPATSRQREIVAEKVNALSEQVRTSPAGPARPKPSSRAGLKGAAIGVGGLALLLWKFKFVVVFLLTKGKLLLLGLTKSSTFFSMLLSLGLYWSIWGWKFALGLVLSIYIHEMGHVVALRRYGFKATAPMFIPGLGALIRLNQRPANPREDADIGLAGPIYGLAAAALSYGLWHATGQPIFAAIARVGAWINLFNLMPLGPLDGGRAFNALSRSQRWLAILGLAAGFAIAQDGLFTLLLLVAVVRATAEKTTASDTRTVILFIGLVLILSLMCRIPVPMP
jgi:Zn-dependent protease